MSDHPTRSELDTASAFADRHIGPGPDDRSAMLAALGFDSLDALMDAAVPGGIRAADDSGHAADELAARRRARATG